MDDEEDLLAEQDPFAEPEIAAHAMVLPEEHIEGDPDRDLDEHSVWDDLQSATTLNPNLDVPFDAAGRLGRRALRAGGEAIDHPIDAALGAMTGFAMGGLDELHGLTQAHPVLTSPIGGPVGTLAAGALEALDPSDEYLSARDDVRDQQAAAREESPHAFDAADTAGSVAGTFAIPEAPIAEGAGWLTRAAVRGLEGAGLTGTQAALASDAPDLGGRLEDAALPALAGGVGGSTLSSLGSAGTAVARGARDAAAPLSRYADRARIASVLGERRAPITDAEMQTIVQTLGRGSREPEHAAAERIRQSGIVGPLSSVSEVADRARRAEEAATGPLQQVRRQFEETGGRVPVAAVPDALERYARELEGGETTSQFAGAPQEMADRWRRVGTERAPETTALTEAERAIAESARQPIPSIPRADEIAARPDDFPNDITGIFGHEELAALRREQAVERGAERGTVPRRGGAARPDGAVAPAPTSTPVPELHSPQTPESVVAARLADVQRRQALRDGLHEAQERAATPTRSLAELERALREHRRGVQWVSPTGSAMPLPREIAQREAAVARDALDDVVAAHPGMPSDVRTTFPADRRTYQTARTLRELSERRALRGEMRADPLAEAARTGAAALAGGGAALPAAAAGAGARMLRGRSASAVATGAELVQRVLQSGRVGELGDFARTLQRAADRSPEAFAATHYVLSQTDPAYRERVQQLEQREGDDASLFDDSDADDAGDDPLGLFQDHDADDAAARDDDPLGLFIEDAAAPQ